MGPDLGLPDEEIDRLLSEAEARLSGNASVDAAAAAPAAPAAKTAASLAVPRPPITGEQTTVPEKKSEKLSVRVPQLAEKKKGPKDTLGADWFNMPRTNLTPELKRDLQVLRMRDVAAMGKQFFKKDTRRDLVPEYSQVGTIIAGATDGMNNRLTRKERKRTIVEEILAHDNVLLHSTSTIVEGHAEMNAPRLIRPLRPLAQGKLPLATARPAAVAIPRASTQLRSYASVASAAEPADAPNNSDKPRISRMPRALEALYLKPLRREAEYGVPTCNLQLRSYSVRNLEFFCDFALRAAYYAGLPAYGPVPLPRMVERWTVPKSTFIFKKSQENFERITLRRLIQIKDGHPETVQLWLAFLQKHAYYGIGMKANIWEFSKLDVGKEMDKNLEEVEKEMEGKWEYLSYVDRRPEFKKGKDEGPREQLPAPEEIEELLAKERRRISGESSQSPSSNTVAEDEAGSVVAKASQKPSSTPSEKGGKIIFSGIQPTGVPHLGNYLGAMREWKRLQDTAEPDTKLFFSIVDLHALTIPRPREELFENRLKMMASLLATGLNPNRAAIFFQSSVGEHAELQWILSCTASMGYLSRMTQWKAADILLYRATHVPVGEDQRQHLEFARECVSNFNHTYKTNCLVQPETLISPARRIMSLSNPLQKMSKSDPSPKSRILITDTPEEIAKKIRHAVTDSTDKVTYDPANRPGVANLIEILSSFDPQGRAPARLGEQMEGYKIAELKQVVAQVVSDELAEIRERYRQYMSDQEKLKEVAFQGTAAARATARTTMGHVKRAIGLGV
ncbi:hypothetical protein MYCTH_101411 [Thermothelomyces thermophilus ATCC 42464]|uniref:Small ribosomal subunit protein uS10m n=1 Tax=Thermothelomyces thermophilus (strain ATCC 42464 / BCRC 31852 / DSM 1799) TaxID=573729 RepID=G2QCF0_THET4|nr:uncharacterized protein MYCTH_101411 [Thermothelomyces thermophilus ATCC 42464]AEO58126.1 hypothetical protein MYCTH_101411 [Thermothelomyces thermophilus ATCC 42464]